MCVYVVLGLCSSSPLTLSGLGVVSDVLVAVPWHRPSVPSAGLSAAPAPPRTAAETSTSTITLGLSRHLKD